MADTFRAYRVFEEDGGIQGRIVEASLDAVGSGEVVARVAYSGVNYKDALAATGAGKIMRRLLKARELGLPEGDTSTLEDD
jgi:NADPH2:quinone reductase